MKAIHAINRIVIQIISALSLTLLILLSAVSLAGIFYRYILKSPITWLYEIIVLIFAWLVFSGVVLAYARGEHIRLTFLQNALPERGKRILFLLVDVLNMIFILMLIFYGFQLVKNTAGSTYNTVNISLSWFYASFPVMGLPMLLSLFDRALRRMEQGAEGV